MRKSQSPKQRARRRRPLPGEPVVTRRAVRPAARATTKTATMRAAALDRFGGPDVLTMRELPVPSLDAGEVLVATHTAGVGSWDPAMREGWWPEGRAPLPLVLGTDGSGTIAAVDSRVRRLKVGDAVYAFAFASPKGGFYAEYVAVAAENAAPVPEGLSMVAAGALPATGLTALEGVDEALGVKRGEDVIIMGASGGVGTIAVQLAKQRGARVLAIASGADGVALVRRLGADAAVDGKAEDVAAAARDFAPDGAHAVLAFAGGDTLERCLEALRPGGRLAYPNGVEPEPRQRGGVEVVSYDGIPGVRNFARLGRAVEAAKLKVPIAARFPLGEAAAAHARVEAGHVLGKVVLRVRQR